LGSFLAGDTVLSDELLCNRSVFRSSSWILVHLVSWSFSFGSFVPLRSNPFLGLVAHGGFIPSQVGLVSFGVITSWFSLQLHLCCWFCLMVCVYGLGFLIPFQICWDLQTPMLTAMRPSRAEIFWGWSWIHFNPFDWFWIYSLARNSLYFAIVVNSPTKLSVNHHWTN
jgi:hypothetical protein